MGHSTPNLSVDFAESIEMPVSAPLLLESECFTLRDKIIGLGPAWLVRQGHFYTLGFASYLDHRVFVNQQTSEVVKEQNWILSAAFADLYEKLKLTLERSLNKKVIFDESLPLPGFHIFTHLYGKSGFEYSHFDGQFYYLNWSHYRNVDFSNPLSITVPIALPECGSGLDIWPELCRIENRKDEFGNHAQGFSYHCPNGPVNDSSPCVYYPYELGNIITHSGTYRHAIHRNPPESKPSFRITLQCHGLLCDDQWVVYW